MRGLTGFADYEERGCGSGSGRVAVKKQNKKPQKNSHVIWIKKIEKKKGIYMKNLNFFFEFWESVRK
jgi:hypothetical protein